MNNEFNQNPNLNNNFSTEPVQVVPVSTEPVVMPTVPVTTPVVVAPVIESAPTEPSTVPVTSDSNVLANENLKKVEIKEYTPPSKAKIVLLLIFFALLVGFILFLPDISAMIENYKSGGTNYTKEEITTGKLICTLDSTTTNLDKNYAIRFNFSENKLNSVRMELTSRGDASADKETLTEIGTKCKTLATDTSTINGVSIRCDIYDDRIIESYAFDLENIDLDALDTAYSEVGGMYPGYKYNQDISVIEKNMNASGYTCNKEK